MPHTRILVAENDTPLAHLVRKGLESEHYAVDVASDGKEARFLLGEYEYDLVIFDLSLPRTDTADFLRHVHSQKSALPVIALTERNRAEGRVKSTGLRVDGFLAKPFSFSELSAHVRELLVGGKRPAKNSLRTGDLELHHAEHKVTRAGRRIELTVKEFALLECLMLHAGKSVSRATIIERVWKLTPDTMTNVADVYIKSLRKKLDDGHKEKLIHTVRGAGYQLGGKVEGSS